ncbi:hypothetical protein BKA70DRAFT_1279110 [Coprinopsis sp. MPI-PUGE-AT-0042]|nr:hypothetical protein BKA70DRAFT_1279110 [Coprinopsis sp. MPI-PUGE-AT-0042]
MTSEFPDIPPSLRVTPFTRSNDPLPDGLRPAWLAHMDVISKTIQSYDDEIAQLHKEIEKIRLKRGKAERVQRDHAAIISTVRLLSPEVIAIILGLAVPKPSDERARKDFQSFRSVSRLWRQTAYSTPGLWRDLGIDLGYLNSSDAKAKITQTLGLWFSRAGRDAPLSLSLRTHTSGRDTSWIFDAIRSANLNLKHLSLDYSIFDPIEDGIEKLSRLGSFVEDLSLGAHMEGYGEQLPGIQLDSKFPLLRSLLITSVWNRRSGGIFPIHHSSLSILRFTKVKLNESTLPSLNDSLPSLRTLILDNCTFVPSNVSMEAFEMPLLERLIIITPTSEEPPALPDFLIMPSLTLFQIVGNPVGTSYTYAMPGKFVASCSSRPVTLDLSRRKWSNNRAHLILLGFNNVHRLYLSSITHLQASTIAKCREVICTGHPSTKSLRQWVRGEILEDGDRGDTKLYVEKEEIGIDEERDTLWEMAKEVLQESFGAELVFLEAGELARMVWEKGPPTGPRVVFGRTSFDDF